ncbi:PLP-dependent aminotransferase family protein [Kiloniella laminariae]|uniref:PLP-dependent aminotransferase family protein n=2 Tax=Kiloniella laminariae TaxID=454162 RepID=A0ABT4LEG2_9PROT|nr:PLP-dependent aminotransferase family protein [Kiloniella laminariae]MCZ4279485.1 PLP-dependent aminotransferase family protein [Kiloniella laminariae]
MQVIRQRIAGRSLASGEKLPSIRHLADRLRVSKSTVVEAYDRLVAEGIIQPRRGSGFYVTTQLPPLSLAEIGPKLDRAVDPFWVSRQSLEADESFLKPGCGWLPPDWMPEESLRRGLRTLARSNSAILTDYGSPLGLPALRSLLARRMDAVGIDASPDQILLTESGTQAIDLLCRFLLEPSDCVLLDDPCYFNFHALLRAHRVKVVSVPYTRNGPDLDLFEQALKNHTPRLYITNSALHNPTGASLSLPVAHRLLKLAEQHDLRIIEDDIFADFEQAPSPRLAALDGLERVVHIGSFSKTLSAAVRCGFIAARPEWIENLIDLKIATTFGNGHFSAELVLNILQNGSYRKHMEELRKRLSQAMKQTSDRLGNLGIIPWIEPGAGLFLWCSLPEGQDAADIARKTLAQNIILAPGNVFSQSGNANRFLRFNVAQSLSPRLFEVLVTALAR